MYKLFKIYGVRSLAYYTSVGPLWHWHPGAWGWQEHPVVYRPTQQKRPSTSIHVYCTCTCITKLQHFCWGGGQNIPWTIWNQSLNNIWNSVFHILIPHEQIFYIYILIWILLLNAQVEYSTCKKLLLFRA